MAKRHKPSKRRPSARRKPAVKAKGPRTGQKRGAVAPLIARNGIATLREPVKLLSDAQALDLARRCRTAAIDKKADNVVMLDIRKRANFADYFILATGRSVLQARSIADGVVEANEMDYGAPVRTEGYNDGGWILVDYGAVIVHVFTPQARDFYNLERLWGAPARAAKRAD